MKEINSQYDEIIESHPEEMEDAISYLEKQMFESNCKYGEQLVPTFLKPYFLSKPQVDSFIVVTSHIMNILEKVTHLYFSEKGLKEYFYIDKKAEEILEVEHGYSKNVVISRPDSFLAGDVLRFVEFNCDSPAGCGFCDIEEEIMRETFPMKCLGEKHEFVLRKRLDYLLDALLSAYHEFAGEHRKPNIAIVDWKEVNTTNEFKIIQSYFKQKGYDTVIADPRELKLYDSHLEYNGFTVDLIYRRAIFKELMNRSDDITDLLKADKEGKVCLVNPLRSRLASNKAALAIMTNKQFKHFFTNEENQIIQKHIPWTRRVLDMETHYENNPVFLRKHIMNHKDHLVLKPADSYGGKDVVIGKECDHSDWTILLNKILSQGEDWVVQRYVEINDMKVPVKTDDGVILKQKKYNINPFVLGGNYAGSMARLSDQSVINVSAGGGLIPAIEYRPKEDM